MKLTIPALIAINFLAFPVPLQAIQDVSNLEKEVQEAVDSALGSGKIPGIVVAVLTDGGLHHTVAGGLRRLDEPENLLTVNDKLHLGSCTKAMTATLAGVLVDEGLLDWDDTIAEHLPEIVDSIDERYHEVSLWHLLTHRGGVIANGGYHAGGGAATRKNRIRIVKRGLQRMPDEQVIGEYHYSNLGYLIAGLMFEMATGESWESLMQVKLFEPLNMDSAGFGPPDVEPPADHAWGHVWLGGKLAPVFNDNPESMNPAGRVHCSISDWAKFVALHLDEKCEHHSLLKPETLNRLHTPFDGPGESYSAGWIVTPLKNGNGRRLDHAGSNTFWLANVVAVPHRGIAVLIVANGPLKTSLEPVQKATESILARLVSDE